MIGHGNRLRVRTYGDWQRDPLDGVRECGGASVALDKTLGQLIGSALAAGYSWSDIARTLGVAESASTWRDVAAGLARNREAVWRRGLASET
jgi:hypothetical protein